MKGNYFIIMNAIENFSLKGKTIVITGGAGLLGTRHAEAVLEADGKAVLLDLYEESIKKTISRLVEKYVNKSDDILGLVTDITDRNALENTKETVLKQFGTIDGLINNAANNPKMEKQVSNMGAIRFENFPLDMWKDDITVGLTGAFLCAQVFGAVMADRKSGVILNISSDLGIIAPDQRIYRKEGLGDNQQTVKPVTYSVVKHGLLGLTKYLATYYAEKGVRCNALCPAGVFNGQDDVFLSKLTNLIPLGRMADKDEYKSTIVYMLSNASSYMTGSTIIVDGGRTCW